MIARDALPTLNGLLDRNAAVGLLGPRQIGKTTLALAVSSGRKSIYLDLENREDRAKLF